MVIIFGFDMVVGFVIECIDCLYIIVVSYYCVLVVEVMGCYVGWIVLYVGLVGGVYVILLFELFFDLVLVVELIC